MARRQAKYLRKLVAEIDRKHVSGLSVGRRLRLLEMALELLRKIIGYKGHAKKNSF